MCFGAQKIPKGDTERVSVQALTQKKDFRKNVEDVFNWFLDIHMPPQQWREGKIDLCCGALSGMYDFLSAHSSSEKDQIFSYSCKPTQFSAYIQINRKIQFLGALTGSLPTDPGTKSSEAAREILNETKFQEPSSKKLRAAYDKLKSFYEQSRELCVRISRICVELRKVASEVQIDNTFYLDMTIEYIRTLITQLRKDMLDVIRDLQLRTRWEYTPDERFKVFRADGQRARSRN